MMEFSRTFTKITLLILLLISVIRYFTEMGTAISKYSLNITIMTVFISFILLFLTKERNKLLQGNYLKISFIFSIGFIIVHFFNYWSYCLGLVPTTISSSAYSSNIVNESSILSLCCYISFAIGYVIMGEKDNNFLNKSTIRFPTSNSRFFELLFFVSLFIFYIYTDKRYFETGGNYEITNGEGLSFISSIAQFILMSSQIACGIQKIYTMDSISIKKYISSYSIIYYCTLVIYFYLILKSGDRGPLMYLSFGYFAPYFLINKIKLSFKYTVSALTIGAILMYFLGLLRNIEGDIDMNKIIVTNESFNEGIQGDGAWLFEPTAQLSNVVRSYNVVYEYAKNNGTIYGLGYIDSFLGFIPGLRTHVIYPLIGIENNNIVNTAYMSTLLLRSDHGMGTTPVGDTYYNFGFLGCLIIFFLFGYYCRIFDTTLHDRNRSLFIFCFSFWFLVYSIYIGRATFFAPITMSIYTWLIIKMELTIMKLLSK